MTTQTTLTTYTDRNELTLTAAPLDTDALATTIRHIAENYNDKNIDSNTQAPLDDARQLREHALELAQKLIEEWQYTAETIVPNNYQQGLTEQHGNYVYVENITDAHTTEAQWATDREELDNKTGDVPNLLATALRQHIRRDLQDSDWDSNADYVCTIADE